MSNSLSTSQRLRPALDILEQRSVPAVRSVIPLDMPADNTSTFHSLYDALQAADLAAGDIVQIEAGSSPGALFNSWIPNKPNLTIQGNPAVPLTELPRIDFANPITITPAQAGFTFQHIGLRQEANALTFQADGTLRDVYVESRVVGTPIQLDGTIAASIINSHFTSLSGGGIVHPLIQVNTAPGSHNLIQGNLFENLESNIQAPLIAYTGANSIADIIEQNTLLCNAIPILVNAGVDGLTIQDNDLSGSGFNTGVQVAAGAKNVAIRRNSIENFSTGITVDAGTSGTETSVIIANNRITGAAGEGIAFNGTTGALAALVEGNELFNNQVGVLINFPGGGIDLGGGATSKGGNNFRGFTSPATASAGAIVVNAVATSAIDARFNLFGVVDPETVIFDDNDGHTHRDVVATNKLTGNAAYVQALFQQYLRRTGDLNDPNDAGKWVAMLNKKASRHTVVQGIAHLPEALGIVVDDVYRSLLHEAPTPAQRATLIQQMADGMTSTTLTRQLFASPEYSNQFVSPEAYVQSVYLKLLGRLPTDDELHNQLKRSRTAIAQTVLGSKEYRELKVRDLFTTVLHRAADDAEVAKLVKLDQSLDAIRGRLAESAEFFKFG